MTLHSYTLHDPHYPQVLRQKVHQPPSKLYTVGNLEGIMNKPRVAIVGSRQITPYGKQVTRQFATELARRGVVIVSGLAYGVDAAAHQATLDAGGLTMAVLPTPLDNIAPSGNRLLARRVVEQGGALVSSYAPGSENHKGNFVARNELVAALSDVVLITEAAAKSGSLHTAEFAANMSVPVLAVPGNITSAISAGTNQLLKIPQAAPATSVNDVFHLLNLATTNDPTRVQGDTPAQQTVLDLLSQGTSDGAELLHKSQLSAAVFGQTLTMLEISGSVIALGGNHWGLA